MNLRKMSQEVKPVANHDGFRVHFTSWLEAESMLKGHFKEMTEVKEKLRWPGVNRFLPKVTNA